MSFSDAQTALLIGFMRRLCTARRTARSAPTSAPSTAAFTVAPRLSNTTLGSPLRTTFIRHLRSMPPRGPFSSCVRTLTRSIALANLPSRVPSLRRI